MADNEKPRWKWRKNLKVSQCCNCSDRLQQGQLAKWCTPFYNCNVHDDDDESDAAMSD